MVEQVEVEGGTTLCDSDHQGCLAMCIMRLASSPSLARAMAAAGAVSKLVGIMRASPELRRRAIAASALAELIRLSASRTIDAAKRGAVPAAAQLAMAPAGTGDVFAHRAGARVLLCTLSHLKPKQLPERQRGLILKAGMHLLNSSSGSSHAEVQRLAACCLAHLAVHDVAKYAPPMLQPGGVVPALL